MDKVDSLPSLSNLESSKGGGSRQAGATRRGEHGGGRVREAGKKMGGDGGQEDMLSTV